MFRETHVNMDLLHEYLLHYRYLLFKNTCYEMALDWHGTNINLFFNNRVWHVTFKIRYIKTHNCGHTSCTVLDTQNPRANKTATCFTRRQFAYSRQHDPLKWFPEGKSRACFEGD